MYLTKVEDKNIRQLVDLSGHVLLYVKKIMMMSHSLEHRDVIEIMTSQEVTEEGF